jgi:cyclic pyranopterin phosphate synthase
MENSQLSHIDESGAARMVDVSAKDPTSREATAQAMVYMNQTTLDLITSGDIPKGDVFASARIAGIMAAKKTHDLIPLCHPLPISSINIDIKSSAGDRQPALYINSTVRVTSNTGVEMEALTACTVAALTIYDMCKSVQKSMTIGDIKLLTKSGGKSGDFSAS